MRKKLIATFVAVGISSSGAFLAYELTLPSDGLIVSRVVGVLTSPPASLPNGTRVAIATGAATGAFAGKGSMLAVYRLAGEYWEFYNAVLAVVDSDLYLSFGGAGF